MGQNWAIYFSFEFFTHFFSFSSFSSTFAHSETFRANTFTCLWLFSMFQIWAIFEIKSIHRLHTRVHLPLILQFLFFRSVRRPLQFFSIFSAYPSELWDNTGIRKYSRMHFRSDITLKIDCVCKRVQFENIWHMLKKANKMPIIWMIRAYSDSCFFSSNRLQFPLWKQLSFWVRLISKAHQTTSGICDNIIG